MCECSSLLFYIYFIYETTEILSSNMHWGQCAGTRSSSGPAEHSGSLFVFALGLCMPLSFTRGFGEERFLNSLISSSFMGKWVAFLLPLFHLLLQPRLLPPKYTTFSALSTSKQGMVAEDTDMEPPLCCRVPVCFGEMHAAFLTCFLSPKWH